MPINVMLLILSLCGPGNKTTCRQDMSECYKQKHLEEVQYGETTNGRLEKRCPINDVGFPCKVSYYPDTALVYECAMDLGVPFDFPVYPDDDANQDY